MQTFLGECLGRSFIQHILNTYCKYCPQGGYNPACMGITEACESPAQIHPPALICRSAVNKSPGGDRRPALGHLANH
jgi:hypothetical protein